MNRTTKKELRNRGLRFRKPTRSRLKEPGIIALLTSIIEEEQNGIRKAHSGEPL